MNNIAFKVASSYVAPEAIRVRRATAADAEALLELCREHADATPLERLPHAPERANRLEFFEALFEPPVRAWAWLAILDDALIGYASGYTAFDSVAQGYHFHIDALYTRGSHDESVVETALFSHALTTARLMGCQTIRWQAPSWTAAGRRGHPATRHDVSHFVLPISDEG